MQLIPVNAASASPGGLEAGQQALAGVIASIGRPDFGHAALAQLNRWMPFCWMSVYTVFPERSPRLHTMGCYQADDGTQDSWRVYQQGLYRQDETFHIAREHTQQGQLALMHWVATEIPPPHRAQIYQRHGLRERLSIVSATAEQGLFALNLYRTTEQRAFSDQAIDAVRALAPSLLACVQASVALGPPSLPPPPPASPRFLEALPDREREVCERLLKGWTQDGIAADLGLAPSTVKTYRNRAFTRLGIHSRHALFALATQPPA